MSNPLEYLVRNQRKEDRLFYQAAFKLAADSKENVIDRVKLINIVSLMAPISVGRNWFAGDVDSVHVNNMRDYCRIALKSHQHKSCQDSMVMKDLDYWKELISLGKDWTAVQDYTTGSKYDSNTLDKVIGGAIKDIKGDIPFDRLRPETKAEVKEKLEEIKLDALNYYLNPLVGWGIIKPGTNPNLPASIPKRNGKVYHVSPEWVPWVLLYAERLSQDMPRKVQEILEYKPEAMPIIL